MTTTAWIIVNVGSRDWCKLAYQFGHELGHVLANSWDAGSKPSRPCQWLEEALVEAFSLRGLGRLADGWERRPPFPNDGPFASAIRRYRRDIVERYEKAGSAQMPDLQAVYDEHKDNLVVLGVNVEGTNLDEARRLARDFRDELGLTFPIVLDSPDGDVFQQYKLRGLPNSFFVDADGVLREVTFGPMNRETILKKLEAANLTTTPSR